MWLNSPNRASAASLLRYVDHTQTQTPGRSLLSEWTVSRRGRYLHSTQHKRRTSMLSAEFEPAIPAIEWPRDLCLGPHEHRDRPLSVLGLCGFYAHSQNCEKRLLSSSCLSVCLSARNNSVPNGQIFMKFDIWLFFENLPRQFNCH
jgi:hypothetical protein